MEDQPGLELAPHQGAPGLEVVPDGGSGLHPAGPNAPNWAASEKVLSSQASSPYGPVPSYPPGEEPAVTAAAGGRRPRRALWWIVGGAVLVAVVVAAVVGGVVGSRAGHKSDSNNTAAAVPTAAPKSIRANSKLSVTGYRTGNDYSIRLFYQGPDDKVRYSDYAAIADTWQAPVTLSSISAKPGTPLASGTYLNVDPPQQFVYYVDNATSNLQGLVFQDGVLPTTGNASNINDIAFPVADSARLAGYHPYVLTQDGQNTMWWLTLNVKGEWDTAAVNVSASAASGMAALPAAVRYLDAGAFVYRNASGNLSSYVAGNQVPGTVEADWAWASGNVSAPVPESSPIGAFAYARTKSNTSDLLNTYVLYQEEPLTAEASSPLYYVWQDTEGAWQGPETSEVLRDADAGTDIACLTQVAWDASAVNVSASTDMNMCFFQTRGFAHQVYFDGAVWHDLAFLPMP